MFGGKFFQTQLLSTFAVFFPLPSSCVNSLFSLQNDDDYDVFPPKWRWFTREHYLVLRKSRTRSRPRFLVHLSCKDKTTRQGTRQGGKKFGVCRWNREVIIQMKATEKYFPIRLLTLYKVVLASFESVCQIVWCDHFKNGILTLFSMFLGILQGKMFSNFGIFALLQVNEIHDSLVSCRNGHFRVPPGLCIKTRLSAQPLILKWFSFSRK